jgi:hypothetical protein
MPGEPDLKQQIKDLEMVIVTAEENYKTAIQTQLPYEVIKEMRQNIKKLKTDLSVLGDQETVTRTGDLPDGGVQ